jgi:RHS repeat-associated protein
VGENISESQDRLGSANLYPGYYPYGEEYITSLSDKDKFATHYRDGTTGLDYANNRYYSSTLGRFMTADLSISNAITDPGQWNKYGYVGNDPVNWYDPSGLDECPAGTTCTIYNPPPPVIDLLLGAGGAMGQGGGDPNGGRDNQGRLRRVQQHQAELDLLWLTPGTQYLKTFKASSEPCDTDLTALGITAEDIRRIASDPNLKFVDAHTNPRYLTAMTKEASDFATWQGAKTVYYLQNYFWQETFGQVLGTLVHEFTHIFNGLSDKIAETVLGVSTPSATISEKLARDCFKGVANP